MNNTITIEEIKATEAFEVFKARAKKMLKKGVHISYLSPEELQGYKDRDAEAKAKQEAFRKELADKEQAHYEKWAKDRGFILVKKEVR